MIIRIPPSLNWLVKKYSYLIYELNKLEVEKNDIDERYSSLAADVEALKRVLRLHEIPLDPQNIPVRRKNRKVTQLKHGEVTRLIFHRLRIECDKSNYVSTSAVFEYIVRTKNLKFPSSGEKVQYRQAIRKRLKDLASQGKVIRKERVNRFDESFWRLP